MSLLSTGEGDRGRIPERARQDAHKRNAIIPRRRAASVRRTSSSSLRGGASGSGKLIYVRRGPPSKSRGGHPRTISGLVDAVAARPLVTPIRRRRRRHRPACGPLACSVRRSHCRPVGTCFTDVDRPHQLNMSHHRPAVILRGWSAGTEQWRHQLRGTE